MYPIRYIHAADLHLDAAFQGLAGEDHPQAGHVSKLVHQATFTALERLVDLCDRERPDFLVIAGDMYNQEDQSFRAQLALRDACESLAAFGTEVFLAHGNHDPLSSLLHTLHWPANVKIFDSTVESYPVSREGETVAIVHGISHENAKEGRNLARFFKRADSACFQLGVLHGTLEGCTATGSAPCTLDDLRASGLDAWALGHVHDRALLSAENPFVLYAGNSQGLHIDEEGERGCFLVQAAPSSDGFTCSTVFKPLGPVIWLTRELSLEGMEQPEALEALLHNTLDELAANAPPSCEIVLTRLRLTGRTPLDSTLRRPSKLAELCERLRSSATRPFAWLKDIDLQTAPDFDISAMRSRDDLLGEALRQAEAGRATPKTLRELVYSSLQPMLGQSKVRKILPALSEEDCSNILNDAERLCIDLLEND